MPVSLPLPLANRARLSHPMHFFTSHHTEGSHYSAHCSLPDRTERGKPFTRCGFGLFALPPSALHAFYPSASQVPPHLSFLLFPEPSKFHSRRRSALSRPRPKFRSPGFAPPPFPFAFFGSGSLSPPSLPPFPRIRRLGASFPAFIRSEMKKSPPSS